MELYLWWIQKYISGKIAQTSISKLFCIISMFYSLSAFITAARWMHSSSNLRCCGWSSGRRSFSVKSSTARISSHLSNWALLCLQPAVICLRNTLRQRTVNRRWIKWAQVGCHVAWKPRNPRELQIPKPIERKIYDQSKIAVRLPSLRDPRATKL